MSTGFRRYDHVERLRQAAYDLSQEGDERGILMVSLNNEPLSFLLSFSDAGKVARVMRDAGYPDIARQFATARWQLWRLARALKTAAHRDVCKELVDHLQREVI